MAIVVIGGHSRSVGKSSVAAGLIARLPERNWTAFKITQFGHGFCSANGEPCDCQTGDHTIAISAERIPLPAPTVRDFSPPARRDRFGCARVSVISRRRCRAFVKRSQAPRTLIFQSNSLPEYPGPISTGSPRLCDRGFQESARVFWILRTRCCCARRPFN